LQRRGSSDRQQPAIDQSARQRVLILSVSAGAGHVRAAEALQAWSLRQFSHVHATHVDVMQLASGVFRRVYANAYINLVDRHPWLWGMLYRMTEKARSDAFMHKLRRPIERWSIRALTAHIAEFAPTAIICTHFLPAEILAHAIQHNKLKVPVWIQVTDFDLHKMWVLAHISGYFAGNDEVAFRMRNAGIRDIDVHTTGIPIMPAFSQAFNRDECARKIGIDPDRMTLLLMGGGAGVGKLERIAEKLLRMNTDFQLIALAGRNAATLAALRRMAAAHPTRLFPHAYTHEIEALMACADLAITKPGGLTSSECLAMALPMILHSPIPGQEERNADYLVEQGVAMKAIDACGLAYRVRELLAAPDRLMAMRERARNLARPDAARRVLRIVLEDATVTHQA